jgi:hypothetical protein
MIVATEYDITQNGSRRIIAYRCQDHLGVWHNYGPVTTSDPSFDPDAHIPLVEQKVASALAQSEFAGMVE